MRVRALQLDVDMDQEFDARVKDTLDLVRANADADLVVLPELWPNGGFTYQLWEQTAQAIDGPLVSECAALAAELGIHLHLGSLVERRPDGGLSNTSVLLGPDGATLATYRKIHLFGFAEGEPALMTAGDEVVTVDTAWGVLGLATCYDLRFPELFRRLLDAGCSLVLVPAAWPAPRVGHWTVLAQARAIENQMVVVAVNATGDQGGKTMGGHSIVVDARGAILAQAGTDPAVLDVDIDLAQVATWRAQFPVLADRRLH
jgi:predicted amidohydrolase